MTICIIIIIFDIRLGPGFYGTASSLQRQDMLGAHINDNGHNIVTVYPDGSREDGNDGNLSIRHVESNFNTYYSARTYTRTQTHTNTHTHTHTRTRN